MIKHNLTTEQRADSFSSKMTFSWLLFCFLMLAIGRPAMAAQAPIDVLQSMTDTLEGIVQKDPDIIFDQPRLRVIAREVVLPNVDIRTMSRWVLGKNWRKATHEQREAFIVEFRELLLSSYLRQVKTYEGEVVRFLPVRGDLKKGRVTVGAEIEQLNGRPMVHAIFRMHEVDNAWKIYDVSVEGISLVATHRSGFSTEIRNNGIDSLIARLRILNERNAAEDSGNVKKAKAN